MTMETLNNDLIARMREEIKKETTNKLNEMLVSNTPYSMQAYNLIKNEYIIVPIVNALYDAYKREQHV